MNATVTIYINGDAYRVTPGITVAAALLTRVNGYAFRHTNKRTEPRGLFCGMGICFDCLVDIDERANLRACMTTVADGMRIVTS